jgi:hypothetical protein
MITLLLVMAFKWPSLVCAHVERTACDDSTEDKTYFK